jgi:aspartyl-tRNA(Asn)/glutamyl-tRNA(Gln) amidotransferase subunit B
MGELARLTNDRGDAFETQPVTPAQLAGLITLVVDGRITNPIAKTVLDRMYSSGRRAEDIVAAEGLVRVDDEAAVRSAVRQVIAQHADAVAQYRGGRAQTFGFLVGQVMKASGGKANPKLVKDMLQRELDAAPLA